MPRYILRSLFIYPAFVAAVGFVLWLTLQPAYPHQTVSGFVYPPGCCHSAATHANGDCAPISSSAVRAVAGGYAVTLAPGQHPKLLTKGYGGIIPHSKARQSPDGDYHICLSTDGASRYCFFAPPMSF